MAVDPLLALATNLLTCLEEQYPAQGTPPGDFCLRAGEDGSIVEDIDPWTGEDLCCTGLGFVRLGRSYPSSNFPEPDSVLKKGSCYPVSWASELQMGLLRCYVPGGGDAPATCPQHTQSATNYATDLYTLKCAINCWVERFLPKGRLFQITDIGPSGPRVNCIQTIANILVQTPDCPC